MHFTKFTITNFKGIRNLEMDFEKEPRSKVQTLVGLNESGKSTILEAISLLSFSKVVTDSHHYIPKHEKYNFNGVIKITGAVKVTTHDNKLIKEHVKTLGFYDIENIDSFTLDRILKFEKSLNKGSSNEWTIKVNVKKTKEEDFYSLISVDRPKWVEIVLYIKQTLLPRILFYRDFLFDFPNRIYLNESFSKENNQLEFREIIQDILSLIDPELNIEDHLIKRIQSKKDSEIDALDHILSKMSSAVSKIVLDAWSHKWQSTPIGFS